MPEAIVLRFRSEKSGGRFLPDSRRLAGNVTRAAEGLPRRRFTIADVEAMRRTGVLRANERLELIGGELVPQEPRGARHVQVTRALAQRWARLERDDCRIDLETVLALSADTFLEPDLIVFPRDAADPASALLVVEIAQGTRRFDMGRKAKLYGRFGLRELWVIDAVHMNARLFRDPNPGGYAETRDYDFDEALIPAFAPPEFALRLDALAVT